ncbi:MAG: hypothetical protein BGO51_05395 [Rhodospirillales bacterium 69-11]|nr:MAG: hypothetical protein BGO51_05395 [Rhodospirillales bacterium 69-11]
MTPSIRRIGPSDAAAFRGLRLAALAAHPEAFGSSYEEEAAAGPDDLRLLPSPPGFLLGGFAGPTLVATTGVAVSPRVKQRHKGTLWGVYVDPAHRGGGIATSLVKAAVQEAREAGLRVLLLAVTLGNDAAIRRYEAAGFRRVGIEPRALCVDGRFLDEAVMALLLD